MRVRCGLARINSSIHIMYVKRENLTEVDGLFVGLSEGDDVGLADGELVIG